MIAYYRIPLSQFTSSKYLGRFLLEADDYWTALVHNLLRSWQKWAHMSWVIIRDGAYDQTLGRIYVAAVQAIILYGLEMWVMTPLIGRF